MRKCIPFNPTLSFFIYFSLPDVLWDPTNLIWRKGTSFEAMTGRTAPGIISLPPLSLATDVTDATFGTSGLWLGTRTGAGGTATLA